MQGARPVQITIDELRYRRRGGLLRPCRGLLRCNAAPHLLEVSEFCFLDVVGNMLSQNPRLEQRVAEDDESADRRDQQPTRPYALSQSGGDIIGNDCCAHERRHCRHPNGVQEVGVKGCPISDENPQRSKGGRPQRGQGATENGRTAKPLPGNNRSHPAPQDRAEAGEHDPAIPEHGRAYPGWLPPEIHVAEYRMIGEKRPIESLEGRIQEWECNAECDREGPAFARLRLRRRCRRARCTGAVELGESLAYIQCLRHDPTPRKSLATWPTIKAYHTQKARKTVTHLRTSACSADCGCRQKYQ